MRSHSTHSHGELPSTCSVLEELHACARGVVYNMPALLASPLLLLCLPPIRNDSLASSTDSRIASLLGVNTSMRYV